MIERSTSQTSRRPSETAKALICLGEVTYFSQDSNRALGFFQEAGRLFDVLGDQVGQAETQLQQGHVYSDLGKLDQAEPASIARTPCGRTSVTSGSKQSQGLPGTLGGTPRELSGRAESISGGVDIVGVDR